MGREGSSPRDGRRDSARPGASAYRDAIPQKEPASAREGAGRPRAGGSRPGAPARPGGRPAAGGPPQGRPGATPARSTPTPARISDSLRNSIEHAYEYHAAEPGAKLKDVIDRIALEFGVDRTIVHEIVSPLHGAAAHQESMQLTAQVRQDIGERYQQMVLEGIRPALGRRRTLAREMGVSLNAATIAVSQWSWRHHDPRELSRDQKFQLEKAYWRLIHEDRPEGERPPLGEVARQAARVTGLPQGAAVRWIDQLNDDPRVLHHVEFPDEATRQGVEEAYREYLSSDAPPAGSLHSTLATRFGCTVRQAHRILLNYRWKERVRHLQTDPEQLAMVESCLAPGETV